MAENPSASEPKTQGADAANAEDSAAAQDAPKEDGPAQEGAAQDSAAQESTAQQGSAQGGTGSASATGSRRPKTIVPESPAAAARRPAPAAAEEDWRGFSADEAEDLRTRWQKLQGDFVDDPLRAVGEADALVEESLRTLTKRLKEQYSSLNGELSSAEEGDTEQLRLTIRHYRTLLNRMLAAGGEGS